MSIPDKAAASDRLLTDLSPLRCQMVGPPAGAYNRAEAPGGHWPYEGLVEGEGGFVDAYGKHFLLGDVECNAVIQQVLTAIPGNHALMMPVRDDVGTITDFAFVAASADARDLAGRYGEQLVGLRLNQHYPEILQDNVWQTFVSVFDDGVSRTVGPFLYPGPLTTVPEGLKIEISLHRAGSAVLCSWTHHDGQGELGDRIAQTGQLGNLGWTEQDLVTGATFWSEHVYRIYGRNPATGPLSAAESDAITAPEDRPIRRRMAEQLGRGQSVDTTYRISTKAGVRHVRVVADTVRDGYGKPLRIYGIVQDVTSDAANRHKLLEVEQRLREQQQNLAAEHRLVSELQEIILPLPTAPVDLPGLRVAVRYLPAEQANRIGGDWYHAARAYDGSVVLAIGDVAGHGIRAAATMAQLRHAFVALTSTATSEPAELLTHLNRLLNGDGTPVTVASAAAARYDPTTGTLRWAQAGHPAPLCTRAGVTTELARPPGPLLGAVIDPVFGTASVTINTDELLVFYTDGLIERRGRKLEEGLASVRATLNLLSAANSPEPLASLLTRLDQASPEDDTCVVGIRRIAG